MKLRKHMKAMFTFSLILNQLIANPVYAEESNGAETNTAEETAVIEELEVSEPQETVEVQTEETAAPEEAVIAEEPEVSEPQETVEELTEETAAPEEVVIAEEPEVSEPQETAEVQTEETAVPEEAVIAEEPEVSEPQETVEELTEETAAPEEAVIAEEPEVSEPQETVEVQTEETAVPEETVIAEEPEAAQVQVNEAPVLPEAKPEEVITVSGQTVTIKKEAAMAAATQSDTMTLHYTNILMAGKKDANGDVLPQEKTKSFVKGQSQTQNSKAALNNSGGSDYHFGNNGVDYTFLNGYVLTTENGEPVFGESISEDVLISKISYKGNGEVLITYADGHTQTLMDTQNLYVSPVYKVDLNWFLDYQYIDEISTGSGSWSNINSSVTSFTHTFREPDDQPHYDFVEWRDEETGITYQEGDKFTYNGKGQEKGTTKTIVVHAYWQPSDTVNYHEDGKGVISSEKFTDQTVENRPEDEEMYRFAGWYEGDSLVAFWKDGETIETEADEILTDASGNRIASWYSEEGELLQRKITYAAPEVTYEKDTAVTYDIYANWLPLLTVNYNEDGADTESVAKFGEAIRLYDQTRETITEDGTDKYQFAGWYDENGTRLEDETLYEALGMTYRKEGAREENVYANWQPSVTLSYNESGEAVVSETDFIKVEVTKQLQDEENYKFAGWYDEGNSPVNLGGEYIAPEVSYTKDTAEEHNIYAYWQPVTRVSYNSDSAETVTAEAAGTDIRLYDNTLEDVTNEDGLFKFAGWYDENGTKLDEETVYEALGLTYEKTGAAETNVYAYWQAPVTVEYYSNDTMINAVSDHSGISAYGYRLNSNDTDGTFLGWYDEDGNAVSEDTAYQAPAHSYSLTAVIRKLFARFLAPAVEEKPETPEITEDPKPAVPTPVIEEEPEIPEAPEDPVAIIETEPVIPEITDNPAPVIIPEIIPEEPAPAAFITEEIAEDEEIPMAAPEIIDEAGIPLAYTGSWALVNLILTVITAVISIILAVLYFFRKKNEEEEDEENEAQIQRAEEEEENRSDVRRKGFSRILSLLLGFITVIIFILTEDMRLPMVLTDRYTLLMAILLIVNIILAVLSKKKYEDEEDEAENQETVMAD